MTSTCRHCHCPLPDDSPQGICPTCFLQLAQHETARDAGRRWTPRSLEQLQGLIPGVQLTGLIGCGGMGAVYRGKQLDLQRDVAVKILPQALSDDPTFAERFRREAQTLAKLNHPNIVTVYGSGVSNGVCYIVMELVEGTTLRDAILAAAIDPAAALRIIPKICDALAYAHDVGVVHRDVKPENILLGSGGVVKMVDFGLAKITIEEHSDLMLTHTGARLGTLRYMSPEQLDGTAVDHRTDIYSLGVVLYEMLTGRVPMGRFPLPSETVGSDPRIDAVVMRTLCHDPAERYQRADEMQSDLSEISGTRRGARRNRRQPTGDAAGWPADNAWGSSRRAGREWKSRSTLMGWPLVHVAYGHDRVTGKKLVAKGVIAIGDVAVGGLACGGVTAGIASFGGVAFGLNAVGGVAIALQSAMGGCAVGGLAIGGSAVGLVAMGGAAIGGIACGGAAVGQLAFGGAPAGRYTITSAGRLAPESFVNSEWISWLSDHWMPYYATAGITVAVFGPLALIALVTLIAHVFLRTKQPGPRRPVPAVVRAEVVRACLMAGVLSLLTPAMAFVPLQTLNRTVARARAQSLDARVRAEQEATYQRLLQQQQAAEEAGS